MLEHPAGGADAVLMSAAPDAVIAGFGEALVLVLPLLGIVALVLLRRQQQRIADAISQGAAHPSQPSGRAEVAGDEDADDDSRELAGEPPRTRRGHSGDR